MTQLAVSQHGDLLLQQLNLIRTRVRFLPARHPSVQQVIREAVPLVRELLSNASTLTVAFRGGEVYLNGRRLPKESLRYATLIEEFTNLGLHSLQFEPGLQEEELTRFCDVCFARDATGADTGGRRAVLNAQVFPHLRINLEQLAPQIWTPGDGQESAPLAQAREVYQQALRATIEAYHDSLRGGRINVMLTLRVVDLLQEGMSQHAEAYFAMSQLREFSEYTYYHCVNVAIIGMLLGKGLGLDWESVRRLGLAAMLHDVGKICVPSEILEKPGRLDEKERAIVETHPLDSVRILLDQKDLCPAALAVAAQHHAGYDLSGYPNFDGYGALHLFSHITTIADVYDALRSSRTYKPAMLPDRAMEILLQGLAKTFHPVLLKAFFRMVGFYPVGSAVELNTGEFGVVTGINQLAPLQPQVRIIGGADRGALDQTVDLNTLTPFGNQPRAVLRSIDPTENGIRIADYL